MERFPTELLAAMTKGDVNDKGEMYWKYPSLWEAALQSPELKAMQDAAAAAENAEAEAPWPRKRSRSPSHILSSNAAEGARMDQICQLRSRIHYLKEELQGAEAELHEIIEGKECNDAGSSAAPTFDAENGDTMS